MKNIESLFELSNYDTKNITNKSSKQISQNDIEKIENQGVTLEFLQAMNVPVFKYRTQITIHGLFPQLSHNYLGGYKMLFQNKNLSIGVKWQAVDYSKKDRIYKTVTSFLKNGWLRRHNSSEFFIYKTSKMFSTKEEYKPLLEECKAEISHLDKSLFFGNSGVYLSNTLWGGYFLVSYINIGAILETNVIPCIENICKVSISEIEKAEAEKRAISLQAEAERKAQYQAEIEARKLLQSPILEDARKVLTDAGYTLQDKQPIIQDQLYIKIEIDTETKSFKFVARKYSKEPREKKWRYQKAESNDLNFDFTSWYNSQRHETIGTVASGYIKAEVKAASVNNTPIPFTGKIDIVNYSEKAIALFGDTKPVKDQLKAMGARFNPFLNYNGVKTAGWILPATKIDQIRHLIK